VKRLLLASLICLGAASVLPAQIIPVRPGAARPVQPVRRDTTDTTAVKWPTPDSVMQRLMSLPGYGVTRYQGETAVFDVQSKALDLLAAKGRPAVVKRDSQTVVSDTGIYYSESTRRVVACGNYILSDPSSGQTDIKGGGSGSSQCAEYNLTNRSATIANAKFGVNNGENWYLSVDRAMVALDTTNARGPTLYARGGTMTSCPDSIPDFHFEYKEAKRTGANTLVARPAILYLGDIPVMWLPFIFSDTRPGRHSGILPPQFGIGDIVRNSPTYRRNVEHVGYYFAMNDYMDLSAWLDWRSGSGSTDGDPGWLRWNSDWQYKWINRFLAGRVGLGYTTQGNGVTNLAVSWGHQQEFSANSRLTTSINYVTSTTLQRQNTFNPYTALATIASNASYQTKFGPASVSLGASRKQYPGRQQVDQSFPTLTISTTPISAGDWLTWTPSFSLTRSEVANMDQPGLGSFVYTRNPATGILDSAQAKGRGSVTSSITFDTPLQIFGKDFKNSFRVSQQRNNFPQSVAMYDLESGEVTENRVFAATYRTDIDWVPDFTIPAMARNRFNFSPSVSLQNVDPGPFWVATERTNGRFVHQSKRISLGVSASPTMFGRFRGFGPFSALRHSIAPSVGYSWAPAAKVSDEYLSALGRTKKDYLGGLQQNAITFGLNQNFEAKTRTTDTTATSTGSTIRLLSINMTPISYDFTRLSASKTNSKLAGFTSETWGYNLNSELLPGFEFSSQYSLFEGSPLSDSAKFKPVLTNVSASFSFGRDQNPLSVLARLFGRAAPAAQTSPSGPTDQVRPRPDEAQTQMIAAQPVAGDVRGGNRFIVPPTNGWRAAFQFSRSSPRPPTGNNVIDFDPQARCRAQSGNDPLLLDACLSRLLTQPTTDTPIQSTTAGGPAYKIPPTTSLNGNVAFNLTPMWATTWQTTYDFERHEFASHIVSLQRELHDWRAIFGFTQSPNGNFAFHFTIALKAEPELKFDYNKATVRSGVSPF
jgi:hypothetical protein